MKRCLNTGEVLTAPCGTVGCVHWNVSAKTRCLHHVYDRALTAPDIVYLYGNTITDYRMCLRRAEAKIKLVGRITLDADNLRSTSLVTALGRTRHLPGIEDVINFPFDFFPQFFSALHHDKWLAVLTKYADRLIEVGLLQSSAYKTLTVVTKNT